MPGGDLRGDPGDPFGGSPGGIPGGTLACHFCDFSGWLHVGFVGKRTPGMVKHATLVDSEYVFKEVPNLPLKLCFV